MKVIYKVPGQHAEELEVPGNLINALAGWDIETVVIDSDTAMMVNGQGLGIGMPYNVEAWGVPVYGPIIVCGHMDGELTDCPITVQHFERIACGQAVTG